MTELNKPTGLPQEKWDSMGMSGKAWYIGMIDKLGGYDELREWMSKRSSRRRKSTLSESDIQDIRTAPKSLSQLAEEYDISSSYVSKIRNGHRL